MQAVIELSGKQFLVSEGTHLDCELPLNNKDEETLQIDKVLMTIDGENNQIGTPYLENTSVTAKILSHFRDKKIIVFKYKNKTKYRRKMGHRQDKTRILIEKINAEN
ncbi:50S ribosomal protein L21 [Candidatus Riflebacteria bacterium]